MELSRPAAASGYPHDIVNKGPKESLADFSGDNPAHRDTGNDHQRIAAHQSDPRALDGDIGGGSHRDADIRCGESRPIALVQGLTALRIPQSRSDKSYFWLLCL